MVVCKYFLQGNCRFGANCRNEHPAGQGTGGGGGAFGSQNRFGALSNTGNSFGGGNNGSKQWTLNVADIKLDLTKGQGRPQWILSTYGAGRNTPGSLFEGNEFSPEELRARFYEMAAKGQEAQADQEAIQLWTKAEQDLNNVASHIDDVQKFMEEAEQKHPNRYDFLSIDGTKTREELIKATESSNTASSGFGTTSPFGQSSNAQNNPFAKPPAATFGQPSAPSAFGSSPFAKPSQPSQPSPFGQPAFGQSGFGSPTAGPGQSTSTFGQPSTNSAFGQPASTSAFGKPAFGTSGFGQSAFGQAAQPSASPAFGQPAQSTTTTSAFGQSTSTPAFGASAFGQSAKPNPFAAPTASSGFGGSSTAFGQPAQASTAFGQPSQPAPAFGQPAQTSTGFGQPAFGQSSQPAFGASTFGQAAQPASSSPFGQAASTTSPFGGNTSGTNAFGQSQQQGASPFGAKPAPTPNTTEVSMDADASAGTQAQPVTAANPFGTPQAPAPFTQASAPAPAAAQPAAALPNTNTSQNPHVLTSRPPKPLHYTQTLPVAPSQTNMNKHLTSYRGQRVAYLGEEPNQVPCYNRPDGKGPEKIWYPDAGATQEVVALSREDKLVDLQDDNDKYTDEIKRQYAYLFDEGRFKDGKIPLVPPMREWCLYDF